MLAITQKAAKVPNKNKLFTRKQMSQGHVLGVYPLVQLIPSLFNIDDKSIKQPLPHDSADVGHCHSFFCFYSRYGIPSYGISLHVFSFS